MSPHRYVPSPDLAGDINDRRPCAHCPLPEKNAIHNTTDVDAAQDAHRRRTGDREDDQ